jgi:DNA polymerase III delta prime subunit
MIQENTHLNKLDAFHRTNRIPHIIFHGQTGSGKKTIVQNFIRKIYNHNEQNIKNNVMFVNCAHGKGIKFIREELKFFAKTNVHFNSGIWFKIIVLINADHLTVDAQSALRRCIEQFSNNTRFFIVIENKNRLLTPIVSRFCEVFVPLPMENGKTTNYHKIQMNQVFSFRNQLQQQALEVIDGVLSNLEEDINHQSLLQAVQQLYTEGIHSFQLVKWLQQQDRTDVERANLTMYFSKIRSEYRCERLLMLVLLDFFYFNVDKGLKSLSFM